MPKWRAYIYRTETDDFEFECVDDEESAQIQAEKLIAIKSMTGWRVDEVVKEEDDDV